ncbi:MAG: hypothetical protein ACRDPK_17245 [Carbonactinosporaceae bacterium]
MSAASQGVREPDATRVYGTTSDVQTPPVPPSQHPEHGADAAHAQTLRGETTRDVPWQARSLGLFALGVLAQLPGPFPLVSHLIGHLHLGLHAE